MVSWFKERFNYLFRSTKGLMLVDIALISLVTAIWGMLSGPMAEKGFKDFVVRTLGMQLVEAQREGRIIVLYHAIGVAVVAILVYLITHSVPMRERHRVGINAPLPWVTLPYCLVVWPSPTSATSGSFTASLWRVWRWFFTLDAG